MNEFNEFVISSDSRSWIPYSETTEFPIQNLPLGVFSNSNGEEKVCSIIGEQIIQLDQLINLNQATGISLEVFRSNSLNKLLELGRDKTRSLRRFIFEIFSDKNPEREKYQNALIPLSEVTLKMPIECGDYTDFYSSKEHATNVGMMFRDPANALLPNWLHLPVGYHGRASSIIVSGTPIKRPSGQIIVKEGEAPILSKSKQLDFELEMAFIIGKSNSLGNPIDISKTRDHIHGLMLFNDWSARDIQKWEYVPLGPFLGKNFASTISPWLIDLDALVPFQTKGPEQVPQVLEYLKIEGNSHFNINLEVFINDTLVSNSNTKYLYWSIDQQLAHHTINGCNMRVGDICASGTISGPDQGSFGSMLELAWKGTKPVILKNGESRVFLQDGDQIKMKAFSQGKGYRIGFGECNGKILG